MLVARWYRRDGSSIIEWKEENGRTYSRTVMFKTHLEYKRITFTFKNYSDML